MNEKELVEKYSYQAKIATDNDKVYKDECVYSFDSPESENGLFICLNTFIAVGKEFLPIHYEKTKSHLYLNVKTNLIAIENDDLSGEPEKKKPSKLAFGIEGGFNLNEKNFKSESVYSLFIYPENVSIKLDINYSNDFLNEKIIKSVLSVIKAQSITLKEEKASQVDSWNGETRYISKHSYNLIQLANPSLISPDPKTWKCDQCDLRSNLWLNLTDGKILCGRRQLDGSGGNNHAIDYYNKTKYPLAVKLGTITAKDADVYSYDEDDMVEDTNLAIHLAHFGINMTKMQKTEKTMAELEIDLNQKVSEWDRIQESDSKLEPLYGSGYTGMKNLGNSCYMNSVMQTLYSVPDFIKKYFDTNSIYAQKSPVDPSLDINFQMSKLAFGLLSGYYSKTPSLNEQINNKNYIKPNSFKLVVGRNHSEFSTKKQQDAHEFLCYLFDLIEKNLRKDINKHSELNPINTFKFQLEDRLECSETHQVRYKRREEFCLSLPVHIDLAINKDKLKDFEERKALAKSKGEKLEPGDIVRPEIRLEDCFKAFVQEEIISDFYSTASKSKVNAIKTTKFGTFPNYLFIQAKKFDFAPDWTPIKLDVSLQVPDILDLSQYRSHGLKSSEIELPEEQNELKNEQVKYALNEKIVNDLIEMGFSIDGSKRSVYNTKEENSVEAATNWAVIHMDDPDFNSPFDLPLIEKKSSESNKVFDENSINSLISFGFSRKQVVKALEATNNNLERAADWIFNHVDEITDINEMDIDENKLTDNNLIDNNKVFSNNYMDGKEVYELVAFISHMGTNANVGHYVAHILKNGKWTIFNDEKVAKSEKPPKDLAYLYLYKRI